MIKTKKIKLIITIAIISAVIFPTAIAAKTNNIIQNGDSSCSDAGTKCKNQVGIDIKVENYKRKTTTNTNDVKGRAVEIIGKGSSLEYNAIMIETDYGKMSDIEIDDDVTLSSGTKLKDAKEDLIDSISGGKATVKVKKFTGSNWTGDKWTIGENKEAIIIVILAGESERQDCCKKGRNGVCTEKLKCRAGTFLINVPKKKDNTSIFNFDLKGNAAFRYVQNPEDTGNVKNLRYNEEECTNARQGITSDNSINLKKNNLLTYSVDNNAFSWIKYYNQLLKYCDDSSVPFNIGKKAIKNISDNLINVYYNQKRVKEKAAENKITSEITTKKAEIANEYCSGSVENCKNIINGTLSSQSLSCKGDSKVKEEEKYIYIPSPKSEKAKLLLNGNTETVEVCSVQCYEALTVVYDPPVASKAGICFPYKVTVKSKSQCGVIDNSDKVLEKIKTNNMCSPVPICEGNASLTQAGPSEDFDNCVNECDGGKYSQKCINKCYNSVYKNKNSKDSDKVSKTNSANNTSTSKKETNIIKLSNKNVSASSIEKAANKCAETDKECFSKYYDEGKVIDGCGTNDIIDYVQNYNPKSGATASNKLQACAKYYMEAKLSHPMGHYYFRKSGDNLDWGDMNWTGSGNDDSNEEYDDSRDFITDDGYDTKPTSNIPMAVGRAAPFYFRDEATSIETLISLVIPTLQEKTDDKYWKKYNITKTGIKRQDSSRWYCDETCYYTGCNKGDALTSKAYTEGISSNLEHVNSALLNCINSSSCKGEEEDKTATFEINIENQRNKESTKVNNKGNNKSGNGTTAVPNTGESITQVCNKSKCENEAKTCESQSMFVKADNSDTSTNGIFGLCYDGTTKEPHYQTTITFPGSWINLKTGAVSYAGCKNEDLFLNKTQKYCSAYDSVNVNEEWWKNKIYGCSNSPTAENKYNINANINKFGKYNWNIKFSCFYAIYNGKCDNDSCSSGNSDCKDNTTKINNYTFKPYKRGKLFTDNQKIGYNWTSNAQITSVNGTSASANAKSYGINPESYIKHLNENEKEDISDEELTTNYDYYFKLSAADITKLKSDAKTQIYTDYGGTFTPVDATNLPGLSYYTSKWIENYGTRRATLGQNNDGLEGLN